jgi:hypothetical protein
LRRRESAPGWNVIDSPNHPDLYWLIARSSLNELYLLIVHFLQLLASHVLSFPMAARSLLGALNLQEECILMDLATRVIHTMMNSGRLVHQEKITSADKKGRQKSTWI